LSGPLRFIATLRGFTLGLYLLSSFFNKAHMRSKINTQDDLTAIMLEIATQNDRGVAITAGALMEDRLEFAIQAHWPTPMSSTLHDTLFVGYGPLASFSAKIDLGHAMGLYGPITRADLKIIKWVRNEFAHDMGPLEFTSDHIAKKVKQLKSPRTPPEKPMSPLKEVSQESFCT
jgi:hypothetical protein